ncbi:hypothetical protein WG68_15335 [Arsukibacterium ikkense]|uniref:Polymer-forming cytoskeletal family protein n=1 Tax=Arsukibacterium ikkense TaxID=336831 RepID=A0A0M2V452_9GAMM|nr:polymer-forming cytoskeletal protein [Arsukibacterium ikkense]KKO44425.1 hypothetical protein WG68_15335 [Arsukibacterium ikkense]
MQVDGYVEGVITSEKTLIISAAGRVKAQVTADKVIINGLFDGELFANTVEILPHGKAHGIIHSDDLCIERGGSFIGETQPTSQEQVVSLSKPDTKVEQIADQKAEKHSASRSENRIENKAQ